MSIYEILAIIVLAGAGGFAWHLYRSDTRPKSPGGKAPEVPASQPMFARTRSSGGTAGKDKAG
ncbi:MAG TPA: hypothetical protein VK634_05385 [Reyranella sp.]|nr:hypothetical protein [Reyranella sp.]